MVAPQNKVDTVIQKVRLCRLKLSSVLNRLENHELRPKELKLIDDRTEEVSNEIRLLVETIQRLMGH
jgi:hypothetical protein